MGEELRKLAGEYIRLLHDARGEIERLRTEAERLQVVEQKAKAWLSAFRTGEWPAIVSAADALAAVLDPAP